VKFNYLPNENLRQAIQVSLYRFYFNGYGHGKSYFYDDFSFFFNQHSLMGLKITFPEFILKS
jgi:hypothetical protein